ncbi:hypothetical protein BGZ83_005354 [Gryganskiella cystojenkinii]|nr:hypothetical protein BGZ83_005354 [Gryganskiella cystojenkinii]
MAVVEDEEEYDEDEESEYDEDELDDSDYDSEEGEEEYEGESDHTEQQLPSFHKVAPVRSSTTVTSMTTTTTARAHQHQNSKNNVEDLDNNNNNTNTNNNTRLTESNAARPPLPPQHHPPYHNNNNIMNPPPHPQRQRHGLQQPTQFYPEDSNGPQTLQEQVERQDSVQKAQQELVMQLTIATNAWPKEEEEGSNHQHQHHHVEAASSMLSDRSNSQISVDNGELVAPAIATRPTHNSVSGPSQVRPLTHDEDEDQSNSISEDDDGKEESRRRHVTQARSRTSEERQQQHQQQRDHLHRQQQHVSNGLPPIAPQVANDNKARMVPYVEDDDEEEEDDEDEYDEEEDDTQEGEDDYSYSEDEEEEDDEDDDEEEDGSLQEYHYGARDARVKRGPYHHRSYYSHYRQPRLDEHFLQKRAITKQVVRRSSLTALLGEATQPDLQVNHHQHHQLGFRTAGPAFGHHHHHPQHQGQHPPVALRPALIDVWAESSSATKSSARPVSAAGFYDDAKSSSQGTTHTTTSTHSEQYRRSPLGPQNGTSALSKVTNVQEPNRPRRTDSGVEVKLPSHTDRDSSTSSSDGTTTSTENQRRRRSRFADAAVTLPLPDDFSPMKNVSPSANLAVVAIPSASDGGSTSLGALTGRRLRIKSDGDIPEEGSEPVGSSAQVSTSSTSNDIAGSESGSASGSNTLQAVRPALRSSISCHTFPRASGKRNGRKHVSWHYSLFPTEPALKIKPSLPSLSKVATTSAEAKLSKLPTVPVMARDNVKEFHQSIRSLRTLSRNEITKMSYKQQGRQELSSTVPISKSVNDSAPWWRPSRWFKASVTIDKRHWKPDDSRESCAYCFAPFHRLTNPRHHCRKCGDIFCGKCASAEILMDAKNCVYVQQSQLARWSRRVDIQRHSLWIDTLPPLHPVRTAVETGLVAGPVGPNGEGVVGGGLGALVGQPGLGVVNGGGGANGYLGGVSMGHRSGSGSGSGNGRRGSWQMAPGATKKSRMSIFGLFANGASAVGPGGAGVNGPAYNGSDSRRGSIDATAAESSHLHPHHHGGYLLHSPHSLNPLAISFAATGRRSSSSSILRTGSINGGAHHLLMAGASGGLQNDASLLTPPITMSRRMSSGGVGEVCLARICVGCERELLKPVPRCNSIAKYYGSLGARNGYRPNHGYSSLGPHAGTSVAHNGVGRANGPHGPQQHGGRYLSAEDMDPTMADQQHYHQQQHHQQQYNNGVRRHSPLGQTSYVANPYSQQQQHQHYNGQADYFDRNPNGASGYGQHDHGYEEAVGPHGETRSNAPILTFQEEQIQYTQQACGPMYRELS